MPTDRPIEPLQEGEYKEVAWGVEKFGEKVKPMWIPRPPLNDTCVKFEMTYCGICHTDCTMALGGKPFHIYPMVTGHELIGRVTEIGSKVTKVKVGDNIGVGCMVDSCGDCQSCEAGHEQLCCAKGMVGTYNGDKKYDGHIPGN